MSRGQVTPEVVARASAHLSRTAIVSAEETFSFSQLLDTSRRMASALLEDRTDLEEARVAFFVTPGFDFVALLFGIWQAGGIAVPLALSHPAAEREQAIRSADASIVVAGPEHAELLAPIAHDCRARLRTTEELQKTNPTALPEITPERRALMLFTSGTTGKPKGVVHTHANINAQVSTLVTAWEWSAQDRTLLVLPLHHVHGLVNVVCCALWSGACCEMLPRFDAARAWQRLASGQLTVFMAVPTVYHRLITSWENAPEHVRQIRSNGVRQLRLMVSGSAALPVQTLARWRDISTHTLLERYGMTEIGMALSNPLHGERRPGSVGLPLPGVSVRLVDEQGSVVPAGSAGEVEVRGGTVVLEYWRNPEATSEAFRAGWFRTGDVAVVENDYYRILGRTSIDIIKSGGYKISALEIEEVLRMHPAVAECAVVGIPDDEWGERICAAIELAGGHTLALAELQNWTREHLAPYKIPRALQCVPALPRNAMGKVVKPDVSKLFS